MANVIRLKRASGSDPTASDLVSGEPAVRTDTGELFFKKDDGSVAKVSGAGGGPDFKYLALRNAANNGAASFPNSDFTLVTSGTTSAITPTAANTLLVSVNGVIQKPNTGTSTPSQGFALSGSTIKFGANISAAPDFILYQESGGIGEPSDDTVSEEKLKVSNSPVNGYFLSAQSGNTGGLTWAAPVATSCTGNSATATALETARTINGTSFDGTANITVTAAAGTLTGTTLNSSVVTSSLTSLGDLAGLTVNGDMALTGANYNVLWDKSDNALEFADNAKATFGTGQDLQIYHDGSTNNSHIKELGSGCLVLNTDCFRVKNAAHTENLIAADINSSVQLFFDNSKKFETTSTGAAVHHSNFCTLEIRANSNDAVLRLTSNNNDNTDWAIQNDQSESNILDFRFNNTSKMYLTSDGSLHIVGNLDLEDNDKLKLGAGDDLQIYHDGSHSYISEVGTGHLYFGASGYRFNNAAQSESIIQADQDGSVELYYNGSKKFETTSGGTSVTGNLDVSAGIDVTGASSFDGFITLSSTHNRIIFTDTNADPDYMVDSNGGHFLVYDATNNQDKIKIFSDGHTDIHGRVDFISGGINVTGAINASSNVTLSGGDFSTPGNLDLGDSSGTASGRVLLGASDDLQIYHDGNHSYFIDNGTGDLRLRGSEAVKIEDTSSGKPMITCTKNFGTEIYHQMNSAVATAEVKFATTSTGVTITGNALPASNDAHDLGSTSNRWRNIYTNDLNLSNEGGSNDVDGTWGSYTIQEGAEDLFLVNKRNGKKYKFNLTEVS